MKCELYELFNVAKYKLAYVCLSFDILEMVIANKLVKLIIILAVVKLHCISVTLMVWWYFRYVDRLLEIYTLH